MSDEEGSEHVFLENVALDDDKYYELDDGFTT